MLQSLHTTAMVVKDSDKEDVSQVVKFHDECNNPGCSFFCPTFDFSPEFSSSLEQEAADILTTVGIDPDEEAKLLLQKEAVPPGVKPPVL